MTKGRSEFTREEASEIRGLLDQVRAAERRESKVLRNELRTQYRFYITDFETDQRGFTASDFDELVKLGQIRLTR